MSETDPGSGLATDDREVDPSASAGSLRVDVPGALAPVGQAEVEASVAVADAHAYSAWRNNDGAVIWAGCEACQVEMDEDTSRAHEVERTLSALLGARLSTWAPRAERQGDAAVVADARLHHDPSAVPDTDHATEVAP